MLRRPSELSTHGARLASEVVEVLVRRRATWAQLLGISAEGRLQHWVWDGVISVSRARACWSKAETYYAVATAENGGSMRLGRLCVDHSSMSDDDLETGSCRSLSD